MRDFTGLLKLAYVGFDRVRGQAYYRPDPVSNFMDGMRVGRTSERNRSSNRLFGNVAALSTAAIPLAAWMLFRKRGAKLSNRAAEVFNKNRRLLSFNEFKNAYQKEQALWRKAGKTLENPRFATVSDGRFDTLSHFAHDIGAGKGYIRMGVPDIRKAYKNGVDFDTFWHELGHAHEAYNQPGRTVAENLWSRAKSKFMPLKYNPKYQEELRAWNNAGKISGKAMNPETMDAALATYRNGILGDQVTLGTGLASAGIIGSRFLGRKDD